MPKDATEQRKLAAIMFTDMVGYTALTQRNEALALELLEEHRRLLRSIIPRFNGTEIKTIGDAFLVEFGSALEAAQCAIEIQRALAKRDADAPAERQIQVRIGIHVGDVVHREGDVLGDGVNIASRIEPLAEPGGICISVDVAHQIQHNLEAKVVTVGRAELRNVQVPLEICRIVLPWERRAPTPVVAAAVPKPSEWQVTKAQAVAAACVVLALCALGLWLHSLSGRSPGTVSAPQSNAPTPISQAVEAKSVAVLPFVNMSADKENEYLSDGITEDLCTALAQVRGLRVPARTSCFFFKGKNEDIRKIGQQLSVATVLEGSVSKAANKLRINVQLINIADGFHLWATNYDREMSDLLALRSEVAQHVVAALRVRLLPGEIQQLEKKPTASPEAHRLYLLGRFFWNQRSPENLKKAVDYFQQALTQDPGYALAYAALASAYVVLPEYTGAPVRQMIPQSSAAALKALELDKTLGEAHAALALGKYWGWDWTGAESEFRRAIEVSPNYATARHWYSIQLRATGRLDEAGREVRRARELDPLSSIIAVNVGVLHYVDHRYDRAIAEYRKALELNPNLPSAHEFLGLAYAAQANLSDAMSTFRTLKALVGNSPTGLGHLGYACAASGRTAEAREQLDELLRLEQEGYVVPYWIALVYHGSGDREQTLNWLEKAVKQGDAMTTCLKSYPVWENLRSEPRFLALLKEMGLGT